MIAVFRFSNVVSCFIDVVAAAAAICSGVLEKTNKYQENDRAVRSRRALI